MESTYKTVKGFADCELTEKRSRFIASVNTASDEQSALDFINSLKIKYRDARHNVYAYSLRSDGTVRYSDDGEPQGTGGIPVLDVIQKQGLCDCVLVVTRYFGGILLGTGGLTRAYSAAAALAVKTAGITVMKKCFMCRLVCDYSQYGRLSAMISDFGGDIENSGFDTDITLSFYLPAESVEPFSRAVCDFSCGKIVIEVNGERFRPIN